LDHGFVLTGLSCAQLKHHFLNFAKSVWLLQIRLSKLCWSCVGTADKRYQISFSSSRTALEFSKQTLKESYTFLAPEITLTRQLLNGHQPDLGKYCSGIKFQLILLTFHLTLWS